MDGSCIPSSTRFPRFDSVVEYSNDPFLRPFIEKGALSKTASLDNLAFGKRAGVSGKNPPLIVEAVGCEFEGPVKPVAHTCHTSTSSGEDV